MKEKVYEVAINSCRTVLKPLVRIFLRFGISHKALAEVAKSVYVDVAIEENPERRNISDIAIRTGISRKEVGKVLDKIEERSLVTSERLALDSLIDRWHQSGDYLDADGNPLRLPIRSRSKPSLEALFKATRLDVPFSTFLRIVNESEKILIDSDGLYFPSSRFFITDGLDEHELRHVAGMMYGFLDTVRQNLDSLTDEKSNRIFQRCTYVAQLDHDAYERFAQFCDSKLPDLLIEFDDWLCENQSESLGTDPSRGLTGMGVYLYDYDKLPYP